MTNIGTAPVKLAGRYPLIQNLGPDPLYIGDRNTVSPANGVKLTADQSYTSALSSGPWVVSSGASDVRTVNRGTGIR